MAEIETLPDQVAALEATFASAAGVVAAFDGELARMRESLSFTGREVNSLSSGIRGGPAPGLRRAGVRRHEAVRRAARRRTVDPDTVYRTAMRPVTDAVSGLLAQGLQGAMGALLALCGWRRLLVRAG